MLQYLWMLWLWLATAPAHALGDDVLLYTGNSGFTYLSYWPMDTFTDVVTEEGCAVNVTEDSSGFPTDLSDYAIVFLLLQSSAFTSSELTLMEDFMADGGVLVLLGDTPSYDSGHVSVFNSMLSSFGAGSTFASSASYDSGCSNTASAATSHALNASASSIGMGWTGDITAGTSATEVYTGPSGQGVVVVEDNLVLVSDLNVFLDDCTLTTGSEQFFLDLYAYAGARDICDLDEDGVDDADCGGDDCDDCDSSVTDGAETYYADDDGDGYGDTDDTTHACTQPTGYTTDDSDCDDTDAAISPGASEVCDSVDNDCDGTTDEDDATDASEWYADDDGDGYGDASSTTDACNPPTGTVGNDTDCDDTDAAISPDADEVCDGADNDCDGYTDEGDATDKLTWYADDDGDSFGDASSTTESCAQPTGYTSDSDDCDDTDADISPDGEEVCDSVDNDCDGTVDEDDATDALTWYADDDGDGYGDLYDTTDACAQPTGTVSDDSDCDDTDAAISPDASEVCDGADNDCDGSTDEDDATDASEWYADDDGDGYGDASSTTEACAQPTGYTSDSDDCDDTDAAISPDGTEVCDSQDNDCDGTIDEDDATDALTWYADDDGDGFGDASSTTETCTQPTGFVSDSDDCDDTDAAISPDGTEVCDSQDNDCDGTVDEDDASDALTWYADDDGDGFGDAGDTTKACTQPTGTVSDSDDCDDTDADISPDGEEVCDGADNDCDGTVDEDDASDTLTWYADDDGDGFGDVASSTEACAQPTGFVSDSDDCDDSDADISPDGEEVCDSIDNDCDGTVDEDDAIDALTWYDDGDGDGFGDLYDTTDACTQPTGYVSDDNDCDDTDSAINPDGEEVCDSQDNDCDGTIDEDDATDALTWYADDDGDGFGDASSTTEACAQPTGYTSDDNDCDDTDADISPDGTEVCDGADNDCDGTVDEDDASDTLTWYADDDGDGFGDASSTTEACAQPTGYTSDDNDCDDTDADISPDGEEVCDSQDNDCDGSIDEDDATDALTWYADDDGDGFGDLSSSTGACTQPTGYTSDSDDCDDTDATINPDGEEVCDSQDNDCDGTIDEDDATDALTWYADDDGDGFGNSSDTTEACALPTGYVSDDTDCDDTDATISPDGTEVCDGADNDCDGTVDEDDATDALTWYDDGDGDGFGDVSDTTEACAQPTGFVSDDADCDDTDATINPDGEEVCDSQDNDCDGTVDEDDATDALTWYADDDGDSFGDVSDTTEACALPTGYVSDDTDCDDTDATINPDGEEVCDGQDNDCDGTVDEDNASDALTWHDDDDGDGFGDAADTTEACAQPTGFVSDSDDCDDTDATINPDGEEVCDSQDNDCDGSIDEDDATDALTWYADDDGDGFGDLGETTEACAQPTGFVSDSDDCDDTDATVNPDGEEVCDSQDNDCDGTVDEDDASDALTWYADDDGDGFGDVSDTTEACTLPSGYTSDDADCDDMDATINPDGEEVCDGADNDCDGAVDEDDATDALTWYADDDGDSFGDVGDTTEACVQPSGFVSDDADCDDTDATVNPDGEEVCDSQDNDCDGTVDEDDASDALTWYDDDDGDGFGDASDTTEACAQPSGFVSDDTDCDDTDATIYPGAEETSLDGVDSDCDGEDDVDADGDGYAREDTGGTDCDDSDIDVYPGAPELADGIDNDCDGDVDEDTEYADSDGDGFAPAGGDCDDTDAGVNPAATETADGVDEDCDGIIDEGTEAYDDDGDGYSELDGDCDDADALVSPDATEDVSNGIDDDCDGIVDTGEYDEDGDGYLPEAGDCDDADDTTHPNAPELEDGIDNDCDGEIDEGTAAYDDDGDGYSELDGDCDDGDAGTSPDGEEVLDGADNNCDGIVDEGTEVYDDDGDGYSELDGDCDDEDGSSYPGAEELEDGVDNDCDGRIDDTIDPDDVDGDGVTAADGDCDDEDGWTYPGALELCDGLDNNCDGSVDEGTCELEEEESTAPKSSGCATGAGAGGPGAVWLLALAGVLLRRRGAALLAAGLVGCNVENNIRSVEPLLDVEPRHDLGDIPLGASGPITIRLTSAGTGEVEIAGVSFDEDLDGASAMFRVEEALPEALAPEASAELLLWFTATEEGWHHARLSIDSDAVNGPLSIELNAHVVNPLVGLWPPRLDFGPAAVGEAPVESVVLYNDGVLTLDIDELAIDAPFSIEEADTAPLAPGEERSVSIRYTPEDEAPAAASLEVRFLDIDPVRADVVGSDCATGDPSRYDVDGDGFTSCGGDCDDADAAVYPSAPEQGDGVDNDCDGAVDEGTAAYDDDGDGYSEEEGDCDDTDAATAPGAVEVESNGIDDDCDGTVDDGAPDPDGDGFTAAGGDCDEGSADTRPGAPELEDGEDNDCDGVIDEGTAAYDDDGDGYSENDGDCDDADAATAPGAAEVADWVDNDCDGAVDEDTVNSDDDGDGYAEIGGDCDDSDAAAHPDAREVEGDGVDSDCDGVAD